MGILIQQVVGFTGNKKETYKRRRSRVRVPSAPHVFAELSMLGWRNKVTS